MNIIKKYLSVFTSALLLFQPLQQSAVAIENNSQTVHTKVSSVASTTCSTLKETFKFLTVVIGTSIVTGFGVNLAMDAIENPKYQKKVDEYKNWFSKNFTRDLTECKITSRQEGAMWCWLACLQGLLRYHNINYSQEDLLKQIYFTLFISPFESGRNQGLSLFDNPQKEFENLKKNHSHNSLIAYISSRTSIYAGMIKKCIEKISDNKLTYQMVYINSSLTKNQLKESINDIYTKIGKRPFMILSNHCSSLHFINIREINKNGKMFIEDPQTAQGRTESLDNFLSNYDKEVLKRTESEFPGIPVAFIVEKENELCSSCNYLYTVVK